MKTKCISSWYIWSLTAISNARADLHRRWFNMLITAVAFTGTARSNTRPLVCMHAVHRQTIDCRVRSKIPGMSAIVPAATVNLATKSFSVSTTDSYTRSPYLTCLDFFLWGHMNHWCIKSLWKQKKTSSLELPSLYLFWCSLPPESIWTNSFGTLYILAQ